MASKTALPLIAGAAAIAFLMTSKSKKASKGGADKRDPGAPEIFPKDRLIINQECTEILNKLDENRHDQWLTGRAVSLYNGGMTNIGDISIQLLKDQSSHCPWDNKDKWTKLMLGLYDQLEEAVDVWIGDMLRQKE